MHTLEQKLKTGAVILLVLGVLGFGLYQARFLIRGPQITIFQPQSGSALDDSFIEIEGEVKNTSKITLNDRDILIDQEGRFREKLLLAQGYNIIKVEAWDRFGRNKVEMLELILN